MSKIKATHSGELKIGTTCLKCAVLEDGTRVISSNDVFRAFGRTKRGRSKNESRVPTLPSFMDAHNLKPFINKELRPVLTFIKYENDNSRELMGYKAEIIPLLCDMYLAARKAGVLMKNQLHLADVSELLVRSLAKIGIIALVDEATGYQDIRARKDLERILEKYISEELNGWAKTFPDEFYKRMFQLKGWAYDPATVKRPSIIGKYTNDIVYARIAPGVLDELRKKNPVINGRRKDKHFQWLTEDIGHPKLREHLASVIALMKAVNSWSAFQQLLKRSLPRQNQNLELILEDKDGHPV